MKFESPEWFLLLPAFLVVGWFWRGLKLHSPLRVLILLVATFCLADPTYRRQDNSMDLWVLLDRSDSTEGLVDQGLPEWKNHIEKSRPNPRRDQVFYYDYASEIVRQGSDGSSFTGSRKLTRTNLALSHIASLTNDRRPSRILLLSDGYSTEPLHEAAGQLIKRGIPLDYRLVRDESTDDIRLSRFDLPERAQAGEPFLMAATVRGSRDGNVKLTVSRGGQKLTDATVTLTNGIGRVEFTDRIPSGGSYLYETEITPHPSSPELKDSHPGNNRQKRWIEITGGPRVILISHYLNDPVATALKDQNYSVELVSDPATLHPGRLAGTKAVIVNNVPAHEIPTPFLNALDFFVREQGGGFLMAGGKHAFGSGGYFESSIDSLLPVSMELKNEHRKLAVALAIVLDRSGSMSVNVNVAGKSHTKMDLANSGAADAIGLLGPMDQVAVFAVDSSPDRVIPLTPIKGQQNDLQRKALSIRSAGGGIYVYEGLKAAWDELKKSPSGTRHIILFSDACDSEQPGAYVSLIEEIKKGGGSVTVIGMGTPTDPDAKLLEDIAKRGNGRIFFSDTPADLPKIFAQETVTIARSAFLDQAVKTQPTGRWNEISPKPIAWTQEIDGYNLSYLRPDSTASLLSSDEYAAPLVAHSRRGLGRTVAISFPLGGDYSKRVLQWPGYNDFLQTTLRFLMGEELPPGLALRHQVDGTRLSLNLLYDPTEWAERFASSPPKIRLHEAGKESYQYDIPWQRIAPGKFTVSRDLEEGSIIRGAIQAGPHALSFGPITIGSSVEWNLEPETIAELRTVSAQTGGRERINLADVWERPPFEQNYALRHPAFIALLVLLVFEALMTRTGWKLPVASLPTFRRSTPATRRPKAKKPLHPATPSPEIKAPAPPPELTPPPSPSTPPEVDRRSRFQRAKERR